MVEGDDVDATRRPADAERNEVLPVYDHLSYPDFLVGLTPSPAND